MFVLNSHKPEPLYQQLYQQIRAHVLTGKLSPHAKLPSVRDLAAELATSRNTVEGAYQELLAEGYIYSKSRSGYFVSELEQQAAPLSLPSQPRRWGDRPQPVTSYRYDFHPARLDPQSFPLVLWRKRYLDCLRASGRELTQYGDPQGDWGLRCSIRSYLERSRGVVCEPEQIVICAGLQQSLEIVVQLLKATHPAVAVENPGYHLPRAVFGSHGLGIVPVAVGANGLDLEVLKASDATLAYVTPSHQLPMGFVMPVAQRLSLIEWAESGGNFILEDDYDSELRYQGKPIPSLQGLRPGGNIIYLGTFSKILSPALRVSYLVLPRALLDRYRQQFRDYFSTVPLLEQKTLARFMEQGDWDRHVRRMRTVYKQKHNSLLGAIEQHLGHQATVVGQGAGLHVVLQLWGAPCAEAELLGRCEARGIRLLPFSLFHATGEPAATHLLLGFGGMTAGEIEAGIALLAQTIESCCPQEKGQNRKKL